MKRKCKGCNILLERKRHKSSEGKGGYRRESITNFSKRVYCGRECLSEGAKIQNTIWSKDKILKTFAGIKSENKYQSRWLQANYNDLFGAITREYGKNYWAKLLAEFGKEPVYNRRNPKHIKVAKDLLRYWREELNVNPSETFEFAQRWYVPTDNVPDVNYRNIVDALNFLRDKKVIRLRVRGNSIAKKRKDKTASKYVLLRTRI